ncbi:hypothetical protein A2276_04025 [candidate division WOR-1 bacterium RIFOXYA12_FULL_43_27]|uniref:Peptidoglycan binding-like domain-containing protein n=1 Tax=candidate division WOR-1 bacterium RIFOXYC2_FULL_46_14 TaxID=1802587 RepID=A0A1F4U759_UNCSA|nr:MAG: hypothetical protein A2276_04025 [candidate division WOR-1 bacterium RIFOXYA12_FULL_43_27]OGC19142.1 MAG: hypothetical protein A2292_00310 [candidate division WOR-1 bacterium RIFOXYB2_FULL_46_45]OGC30130.1 MAG: hypothetical protein A2232_00310 [candidate division WOR-1 bacterium RIFOXYA2_FULL_46_56]OGC40732.1 MAG: hypothetical protein A2438_00315 [candidate division WOR-1 bacterium RIFOXYC2_FULL_46_14]
MSEKIDLACRIKTYWYQVEAPKGSKKELLETLDKDPYIKDVFNGKKGPLLSIEKEGSGSDQKKRAVRYLQQGLISLGLLKTFDTKQKCWWARADFGVYGSATTKAVAELQKKHNIADEGQGGKVCGPKTLAALKKELAARPIAQK